MKDRYFVAALAALASATSAEAAASGCTVASYVTFPVTMVGLQPLVRVKINDRDASFIADSGAFFSMISPGSAAEYGLRLETLPPGFWVSGIGGTVTPRLTTVTLTIGGVPIPKMQFLVGGSEVGSVGLLGQNILAFADTEFDLANGAIRMMRSQGCSKANLAYWAKPNEAYSELKTEIMGHQRPHIIAPVYVNGIKLRAAFDTGAGTSFISLKAAARLGLKPDMAGVTPAGGSSGIGRHLVPTWIGPVQSVKIGDEEVRNTRIRFGGDLDDIDMLVGADFFLSHHVYWSDRLHKMFFTFNGGHVFDLRYLRGEGEDEASQKAVSQTAEAGPAPTDAGGFSRRGAAREARGDFKGALGDFDEAVKRAPDEPDFLRQRALLEARQQQFPKALADIDHLLKIKPNDIDARLMRVELRRRADEKADVRGDIDAAAAAAPKSSDRRLEIAGLYDMLGDFQAAIGEYDLWIAAHPDDSKRPVALNGRCWARAMIGSGLDLALKDCNAALAARPHNPAFLDSRGMVRMRMGDYARAITDYDEVLARNANEAWSLYGRGIAKLRLGQKEAGEADLKKSKSLDAHLADEAKKRGIVP